MEKKSKWKERIKLLLKDLFDENIFGIEIHLTNFSDIYFFEEIIQLIFIFIDFFSGEILKYLKILLKNIKLNLAQICQNLLEIIVNSLL